MHRAGDLVVLTRAAEPPRRCWAAASSVAKKLRLIPTAAPELLSVTDFPLFLWNGSAPSDSVNHPFGPAEEDLRPAGGGPRQVLASAYT